MPVARHAAGFRVPAAHPALPGHFPGHPVVPGVVLLDHVLEAAETWLGRRVTPAALPRAKFLASLKPDETASVELELEGRELRFRIARAEVAIGHGAFLLADVHDP